MMSVFGELKRRNVFKVGIAYLAVAWLILQVVSAVNEPLDLPERFDTVVIVLLAIGLPIALFLAWAYELTPQGLQRESDAATSEPLLAGPRSQRLNYLIIGALSLAVVFLIIDRFSTTGRVPVTPADAVTRLDEAAPSRTAVTAGGAIDPSESRISIAVLPFRNLSSDPDVKYHADGLAEQLTTELRRIPELLVTDWRAAFIAAENGRSLEEISQSLDVAYVLDGNVASNGDQFRIAATLTRPADGTQLWTDTWEFNRANTFELRDSITQRVGNALSVSLGVLSRRNPAMTENVEAYNEYLSGLGHLNRFSTAESRTAIRHFERAIALDNAFIEARIALAFSNEQMAVTVPPEEATQWRERRTQTLLRALDFTNEDIAIARINGILSFLSGNWLEAASALSRLDALGFYDGNRSANVGSIYLRTGRIRDAIERFEEARALAPQFPGVAAALAFAYSISGDYEAAMAEIDRGLELATDGNNRAVLLGATWLTPLAYRDRAEFERRLDAAPGSLIDIADAMRERLDDPGAALAEIRKRLADNPDMIALEQGLMAHFAAYFGDPDLALEIMRSMPAEEPYLPMMLWDAGQSETRRLPGFKELVTDLGLVAYWREYGWGDFCRPLGSDDFVCE